MMIGFRLICDVLFAAERAVSVLAGEQDGHPAGVPPGRGAHRGGWPGRGARDGPQRVAAPLRIHRQGVAIPVSDSAESPFL